MAGRRINIILLTSSRADFSIYLPLLLEFKKHPRFNVRVIAFGTHASKKHGYTVNEIKANKIPVYKLVPFTLKGDSPADVAHAMGDVTKQFSAIWKKENKTDLIICLGDRYEMFSAVLASVPFQIPVAHIHGGEETFGAIDNVFRHSLTQMSTLHFVSAANHAARVKQLVPQSKNIYNVGALSIDSMKATTPFTAVEFKKRFGFTLKNPVLATLHPETAGNISNVKLVDAFVRSVKEIAGHSQVVITLPNADAGGGLIRSTIMSELKGKNNIHLVESLGVRGYYTVLANCRMVMGNSSSGIIEAATFKKWVINIGDRQHGRTQSGNVVTCRASEKEIIHVYRKLGKKKSYTGKNQYGDGRTAGRMVSILSAYFK